MSDKANAEISPAGLMCDFHNPFDGVITNNSCDLSPVGYLAAAQAGVVEDRDKPVACIKRDDGVWFFDFGRDAFGTLELQMSVASDTPVVVRLGEVLTPDGHAVFAPPPRSPACSRRFRELQWMLAPARRCHRLELPRPVFGDEYQPRGYDCAGCLAIPYPAHTGELMPFRYVELVGAPESLRSGDITRITAHHAFDDQAADFLSTDEDLNRVWGLCKHTVKATSCFGVYIDGDRERLVYAGDAWLGQLAHAALDCDFAMGRNTLSRLLMEGCWCFEWALIMPAIAWTDYQNTGDVEFLLRHYDALHPMALWDLKRADGLLVTGEIIRPHPLFDKLRNRDKIFRDLVDWPKALRDGYEIGQVNLSANVLHWHALGCLAGMADALGRTAEASGIRAEQARVAAAIFQVFFDRDRGLFVDSEGSSHNSLHANALPLALGLVKAPDAGRITSFLLTRGMQCGLWGAFFLLEALWRAGAAGQARALMTAAGNRSWTGMLRQGATMTMECWNDELKPNQTWGHVWGATPAYFIARRLMGVRPLTPGFGRVLIAPEPGALTAARLRTPTIHGAVDVEFTQSEKYLQLAVDVPSGVFAEVRLPVPSGMRPSAVDGFILEPDAHWLARENVASGRHEFQVEWCPV